MSIFGKKKSTALKILLPNEQTPLPITTVVYDCPYCGKGFVSPLVGLSVEKVIGNSLPLKCPECLKEFTLEVKINTPTETM